jgi:hypothetical protein
LKVQVSRAGLPISPSFFALVRAQASRYCNSVLFPEWTMADNSSGMFSSRMTLISISELDKGLPASAKTLTRVGISSWYFGSCSIREI